MVSFAQGIERPVRSSNISYRRQSADGGKTTSGPGSEGDCLRLADDSYSSALLLRLCFEFDSDFALPLNDVWRVTVRWYS